MTRPVIALVLAGLTLPRPGGHMPTRRTMELVIVTAVLLQPVLSMARIWLAKHQVTSSNQSTGVAAEVAATVL